LDANAALPWDHVPSPLQGGSLLPLVLVAVLSGQVSHGAVAKQSAPTAARCNSSPVKAEYVSLGTAGASGPSCRGADRSAWRSTKGAGSKCIRSVDCTPACCACPTAGKSALGSWCREGVCSDSASACCARDRDAHRELRQPTSSLNSPARNLTMLRTARILVLVHSQPAGCINWQA
jgi:hypothetical protein